MKITFSLLSVLVVLLAIENNDCVSETCNIKGAEFHLANGTQHCQEGAFLKNITTKEVLNEIISCGNITLFEATVMYLEENSQTCLDAAMGEARKCDDKYPLLYAVCTTKKAANNTRFSTLTIAGVVVGGVAGVVVGVFVGVHINKRIKRRRQLANEEELRRANGQFLSYMIQDEQALIRQQEVDRFERRARREARLEEQRERINRNGGPNPYLNV